MATKAKHAPGPWSVERHGRTYDNTSIEVHSDYPTKHCVAVCSYWGGSREDDVREANAALIAAAPNLLEALKGMLEWARRVHHQHSPGMEIATALSALAKAEPKATP